MRRKALNGSIDTFTRERYKLTRSDKWANPDTAECGFLFTYKWDGEVSPEMIVDYSIFTIYGDGAVLNYEDVDCSVGYSNGEIYIEYIIYPDVSSSITEMWADANVYVIMNINDVEYEFVYNYYKSALSYSKLSRNDYLINDWYDEQFYISYEVVFENTDSNIDLGDIVDWIVSGDFSLQFDISMYPNGNDYFDTKGLYSTYIDTKLDTTKVYISDNKIYIAFDTVLLNYSDFDWNYEGDIYVSGYQDVSLDGSGFQIDIYTSNGLKLTCYVEI